MFGYVTIQNIAIFEEKYCTMVNVIADLRAVI